MTSVEITLRAAAATQTQVSDGSAARTSAELAGIAAAIAASGDWIDRVRLRRDRRWYERLYCGNDHDVWLISWMPGQHTGFHDHGESSGAFTVAAGALEELRPAGAAKAVRVGETRAFGPGYSHDVRNASSSPAISIHAYSPPLTEMNEYELEGTELVPRAGGRERRAKKQRAQDERVTGESSIEKMLAGARARLRRLSPQEAHDAVEQQRALLVDIRPESQRAAEGSIAGAVAIERNVLEWRLDPTSSSRLPIADAQDLQVIVFCSEGYTSSLAAAALQDLGLWRATDISGGFQAWRAQGLPVDLP